MGCVAVDDFLYVVNTRARRQPGPCSTRGETRWPEGLAGGAFRLPPGGRPFRIGGDARRRRY